MDDTERYSKNPSIIYREEEDGAFLFDPDSGNLKYMNRTAKEVFLLLDGQTEVSQVVEHLLDSYPETDRGKIQKDVGSFLDELRENGFIATSEEPERV